MFPTGVGVVGASSTLNLDFGGVTLPNAAFAPLGNSGQLSIYATFQTDFIIDVFGYFVPAATSDSGRLVTVTPARILDTRSRLGWAPASPGDAKGTVRRSPVGPRPRTGTTRTSTSSATLPSWMPTVMGRCAKPQSP